MNYITDNIFQSILDWSEAWITIIPLIIFFVRKNSGKPYSIVVFYLFFALLNNTAEGLTIVFFRQLPGIWKYNNWLYNLHSIFITCSFVLFFRSIELKSKWLNVKWILPIYLTVVAAIFLFVDDFFIISSRVFTIEGLVLLVYCASFFLQRLKDEQLYLDFDAPLIIVTGLAIYESVNFFIFLFFNLLMTGAPAFASTIWDVHNWVYIVFCLFISYAFYGKAHKLYSWLRR